MVERNGAQHSTYSPADSLKYRIEIDICTRHLFHRIFNFPRFSLSGARAYGRPFSRRQRVLKKLFVFILFYGRTEAG